MGRARRRRDGRVLLYGLLAHAGKGRPLVLGVKFYPGYDDGRIKRPVQSRRGKHDRQVPVPSECDAGPHFRVRIRCVQEGTQSHLWREPAPPVRRRVHAHVARQRRRTDTHRLESLFPGDATEKLVPSALQHLTGSGAIPGGPQRHQGVYRYQGYQESSGTKRSSTTRRTPRFENSSSGNSQSEASRARWTNRSSNRFPITTAFRARIDGIDRRTRR